MIILSNAGATFLSLIVSLTPILISSHFNQSNGRCLRSFYNAISAVFYSEQ